MKVHIRSPFVWSTGRKWRFRLEESFRINLAMGWNGTHEFWDNGELWARLVDDDLEIVKGYSWDGASPAVCIFGKWVGTPTPKAVMVPSLIHDVLGQFSALPCVPWDKKIADDVFFNLMEEEKWRFRGAYHGAVRFLGGFYRRLSKGNPNAKCTFSHESSL